MTQHLLKTPRGALVLAKIFRHINKCEKCAEKRARLGLTLFTPENVKDNKKVAEIGDILFNNSCEECQAYTTKQIERLVK